MAIPKEHNCKEHLIDYPDDRYIICSVCLNKYLIRKPDGEKIEYD